MEEYFNIGKFGKTIGLKGFIKINLNLKNKNLFENIANIFTKEGKIFKKWDIESIRSDKTDIIKLSGIDDINKADNFKDKDIFVIKNELEQIDDFYFYSNEIIDSIVYENNIKRGVVTNFDNFGASDIIEIMLDNGKKILIPFIESIVKEINIKEKKVYVENIDDYI